MRIIAGTMRGLKLSSPDGLNTRPTLDRVKEAVFSMLTPYLIDAKVLDLFAGSGAMGLEALSRGASKAVFVDNDKNAISCVKTNIKSGRAEDRAYVVFDDACRYLSKCSESFDIIFLDPPYLAGIYDDALKEVLNNNILNENGIVVVEWDYENGFTSDLKGFCVLKEKKYGRVGITTLKRGDS